jgi:hypothetical protein
MIFNHCPSQPADVVIAILLGGEIRDSQQGRQLPFRDGKLCQSGRARPARLGAAASAAVAVPRHGI